MKALMKKKLGFTLIELLIVIGILGILVVAVLLTLNPAEAQRKARDAQRIKDAGTLQAIVDQVANSGVAITGTCLTSTTGCSSVGAGAIQSQPCTTANFLGLDVCSYAQSVPLDPLNSSTRTFIAGGGTTNVAAAYRISYSNGTYEVNVRQESTANSARVTADGGNASSWFETGNNLTITAE